jgi:hypothetical protein
MIAFREIREYRDTSEFEHYVVGLFNFVILILNEETKIELNKLNDRNIDDIIKYIIDNMIGFYCDVYDGESYIIGIKK